MIMTSRTITPVISNLSRDKHLLNQNQTPKKLLIKLKQETREYVSSFSSILDRELYGDR